MQIFVLWQSLVVETYRSFFVHLQKALTCPLSIVAPHKFRELGGQEIVCAPFFSQTSEEIKNTTPKGFVTSEHVVQGRILRCYAPHVQAVLFIGLTKALKGFFHAKNKQKVFVCMAEPYSVTAFLAYLSSRFLFGKNIHVILYSAQNISKKFPFPLLLIQKWMFQNSFAILSVSNEVSGVLREQGYKGLIIPFPLWYQASLFYPREQKVAWETLCKQSPPMRGEFPKEKLGTKKVISYCGSLSEDKGVPDFLLALTLVAPKLRNQAIVLIAGKGPCEPLVQESFSRLKELGISCHFFGPLTGIFMPDFFSLTDVLVVPSRTCPHWKEQFGRVIVEARACGSLVIGSKSGEIPVLLQESKWIFEERNPISLAHCLQRTLNEIENKDKKEIISQMVDLAKPFSDKTTAENFGRTLLELIE